MMNWLAMGGYAGYVWSAFGTVFVVLLAEYWFSKRLLIKTKQRLLAFIASYHASS